VVDKTLLLALAGEPSVSVRRIASRMLIRRTTVCRLVVRPLGMTVKILVGFLTGYHESRKAVESKRLKSLSPSLGQ
jgi:hypothetical protein